jgi:hypothetical protein
VYLDGDWSTDRTGQRGSGYGGEHVNEWSPLRRVLLRLHAHTDPRAHTTAADAERAPVIGEAWRLTIVIMQARARPAWPHQ